MMALYQSGRNDLTQQENLDIRCAAPGLETLKATSKNVIPPPYQARGKLQLESRNS